jgi:serine phosphatase RsbU (regulator of sigma subunit)
MFSIDRLCAALLHTKDAEATDINKAILEEVKAFTLGETAKDDMTVISLRT